MRFYGCWRRTAIVRTLLIGCSVALIGRANGASIVPLTSFGGGDGWIAPGENSYSYLGTGSLERGLGYANGHLYLASRNGGNNVRILDGTSGADLGALSTTGVTGGTFAINTVAAGGDGAIYISNLTTDASASPLKIYKWANEASSAAVAYSGTPLAGARAGDSLAATGAGSSTRLAVGFSGTPAVTGNNGYAILNPSTGTSSAVAFPATSPDPGDFRLGLAFTAPDQVIGSQGHNVYRHTSFSGTSGTLITSPALVPGERLLAYTVLNGSGLLATLNTTDAAVNIYDADDLSMPVLLGSANNTSGTLATNSNFTGQLVWGDASGPNQTLYAMSTNHGIQAFTVSLPEPSVGAFALAFLSAGGSFFARRPRS